MNDETRDDTQPNEAGIAEVAQNDRLEHSQSGTTTRDDATDVGVPMLQGDPSEPTGPEDALGDGAKRGDYRDRLVGESTESVPVADAGKPVTRWVDRDSGAAAKANAKNAVEVQTDLTPTSQVVRQNPRADEIGDVAGKKGGVTSGDASPVAASDASDAGDADTSG